MPEAFDNCVQKGGRVRTVSGPNKEHGLKRGQYQHFCFLGEQNYAGEIKTRHGAAHKMVGKG